MTQDPTYNTSFLDTYHNGDLFWYSTLEHYVTESCNFTKHHNDSKMVYLWVSKNEIQAILHGFQLHGRIHFTVTADKIPGHGLNTTCNIGVCVGRLVPSLAELYKDCFMDLDIYSLKTPNVSFEKNLAVLNGEMVMFADIRDPNKHSSTRIAKLDLSVTLRVKLSITNTTLQGEIVAFDPFIKGILADPKLTDFNVR
ncbi:uncharacterized protein LOC133204827 [Saccostrea echinata]|uniref:uncharacterized protein LOC133188741 n=1 Tax=Saccostrea echinata TaxID=191078 RepID=UPI002A80B5EB|nr:uncharacterized protein LOC133188741 [Saccostrea echinata]XP_061196554.1 uncharacterized protein LOC133204827 [Saccostrea echinata]